MLEDDLDHVKILGRTDLRNQSPARSDDSGFHGSDPHQHNGFSYKNGNHQALDTNGGYVSVFAQHAKSSSIYEDMDKRLLQSKPFGLSQLPALQIDSNNYQSRSKSPVAAPLITPNSPRTHPNRFDYTHQNSTSLLMTGASPMPPSRKLHHENQVAPPPLPAKPAPAPRNSPPTTKAPHPIGVLPYRELQQLSMNQTSKKSTDSLLDDEFIGASEETEEEVFERIEIRNSNRETPSPYHESEDSALPPESSSLSPTSSNEDHHVHHWSSNLEDNRRNVNSDHSQDRAKMTTNWKSQQANKTNEQFVIRSTNGTVKTGWQQIKDEKGHQTSVLAEKNDGSSANTSPRKGSLPIGQLIKQFAQKDTGAVPVPSTTAAPAPRPVVRGPYANHVASKFEQRDLRKTSTSSERSDVTRTYQYTSRLSSSPAPSSPSSQSFNDSRFDLNRNKIVDSPKEELKSSPNVATMNYNTSTPKSQSENVTSFLFKDSPPSTIPNPPDSPPVKSIGGLDFSRYDVPAEEVIGRPVVSDDSEPEAQAGMSKSKWTSRKLNLSEESPGLLSHDKEVVNSVKEELPTEAQMEEIRSIMRADVTSYKIFTVRLNRPDGFDDGSVGIILTSAITGRDNFITVQRVITGSIADRDDRLIKGDRVFFINNQSTVKMEASAARTIVKAPAKEVVLVVGRFNKATIVSEFSAPLETTETFTDDPATHRYSDEPETIVLNKGDLGVGFSMDGGLSSRYGDRPIIVKKIFAVGAAQQDGRMRIGDRIATIDGIELSKLTQLEAWKTMKSRPEGPVVFKVYKRLD